MSPILSEVHEVDSDGDCRVEAPPRDSAYRPVRSSDCKCDDSACENHAFADVPHHEGHRADHAGVDHLCREGLARPVALGHIEVDGVADDRPGHQGGEDRGDYLHQDVKDQVD